jgi:hypothetical protein
MMRILSRLYKLKSALNSIFLMRREIFCIWVVLLVAFCIFIPAKGLFLFASDEEGGKDSSEIVLKNRDGLNFNLPEDWPIEKRGGVVAPIPVEEYLSKKFKSVEERIRFIEQQVGALDMRVRILEEQSKKQQRLQSVETVP